MKSPGNDSKLYPTQEKQEKLKLTTTEMDDRSFHSSTHIDKSLKEKIQKGQYVDLVKFLPKEIIYTSGRLNVVNKEGVSYFVPTKEKRLQLFHCDAASKHLKPILQYIQMCILNILLNSFVTFPTLDQLHQPSSGTALTIMK